MFSIRDAPVRFCDSLSRREILRVGGLSAFGLSLPDVIAAREQAGERPPEDRMFGRAKNVIYLYMQGGPPQHETFDPKPDAPAEIRGVHNPIQTNIPGIQFCELLPRTARIADKLAVVRSMSTDDNTHSSSGYWVLTGYKYRGPNPRTIQPTDWPYFGSIVKMLKPSETLPSLSVAWIPDMMRLNENVTPAGQTAGFLGGQWHPDRFVGDPSHANYKIEGFSTEGVPPMRLSRRVSLLQQVERHFRAIERGETLKSYDSVQSQAFDLMTSGRARAAFAIERESDKLRHRYGRSNWGQCLLLARRLIESGVRMVHVNWPREPGDNASDNPMWDTHAQNADRMEDVLCPQFDVGFTALMEDLDDRGLLDETLVVVIGEFGRTPKINPKGGRDHWGPVFSFALAGAGISGGQVYGASDKHGAYPVKDRVRPQELTATIFHLLGINYLGSFRDREGKPSLLTQGAPLFSLLGTECATSRRQDSNADIARVPPYDRSLLLNSQFTAPVKIRSFDGPPRPKGWRAKPLLETETQPGFGVRLATTDDADNSRALIGFHSDASDQPVEIKHQQQALLCQEVRNPYPGRYRLSARFRVQSPANGLKKLFAQHFAGKLMFFQFANQKKNPKDRSEHVAVAIPIDADAAKQEEWQKIEVEKNFVNPNPGGNFSFGSGLGIGILIEKTSPGVLRLADSQRAFLEVDEVSLEFIGKERIDTVKV